MSAERTIELRVEDLWNAVLNLSLPASDQIELLTAAGDATAVDELALELEDCLGILPRAIQQQLITQRAQAAILKLNDALDHMSGPEHSEFWTDNALHTNTHWQEIRRLAQHCLLQRQLARIHLASA